MKWRPDLVIQRLCHEVASKAAQAIRSAPPRLPHRGSPAGGATGGSLAAKVLGKGFVQPKPWGAVLRWFDLGQVGLWFHRGSSRQRARPFDLAPSVEEVTRALQASAERHYQRRADRLGEAS